MMKNTIVMVIFTSLLTFAGGVYADEMGMGQSGTMTNDNMSKDATTKDNMGHVDSGNMNKDGMAHDSMGKDDMSK